VNLRDWRTVIGKEYGMGRVVTIDDASLIQLASDPRNVVSFPLLAAAAPSRVASCCGGGRNLGSVKASVAALPDDRLAEFKKLLGADRLRVMYSVGGQFVDVTV